MASAVRLYQSLGFTPTAPYCDNPIPGAMFFGRELTHASETSREASDGQAEPRKAAFFRE
jgi:hypothetical protein